MDTSVNDRNEDTMVSKKRKGSLKLRNLRLCLMYRPKILKLILKMRQSIKRKNTLVNRLKKQLKLLTKPEVVTTYIQTEDITLSKTEQKSDEETVVVNKPAVDDVSTQTEDFLTSDKIINKCSEGNLDTPIAWNVPTEAGIDEKSIAEQVKEVAQTALQENGMVYVESAGMYYDYKTGYYYNSELGLYYHTDTSCYYSYSDEKQTFVFHSYPDRSIEVANAYLIKHEMKKAKKHKKEKEEDCIEECSKPKRKKKLHKQKKAEEEETEKRKTQDNLESLNSVENIGKELEAKLASSSQELGNEEKIDESKDEMEDGECSATDSEESAKEEDIEDIESNNSTSTDTDNESVAKHHPPCMRLIVRETNLPKLKVGSLFLITKDGGSIGREGDQHAIVIGDSSVSRNHLDIRYNMERNIYLATDLGSKNGTILNGIRMSESQDISVPMEVVHGSIIQLGETKLLCHIHPGTETCGHCEPGLILETEEKEKKIAYTRTCSVQRQHQLELARLKNKYSAKPLAIEAEAYNDRAQARRDTVGSSHHAEKTQSGDIDTFIASENKGFKLLEKMGWSKGEGLGKDNQGDKEPIPLVSNEGKSGLGSSSSAPTFCPPTSKLGPATLRLAARTKMLQPPAKAFQESVDYDSE